MKVLPPPAPPTSSTPLPNLPIGPLKIGDYITLKNLRMDSYLSAEGILCEDIIMSQDMNSFEDSVFSIHYSRQYSAARELEEFLITYDIDVNNITDPNTMKFLHALQVHPPTPIPYPPS